MWNDSTSSSTGKIIRSVVKAGDSGSISERTVEQPEPLSVKITAGEITVGSGVRLS